MERILARHTFSRIPARHTFSSRVFSAPKNVNSSLVIERVLVVCIFRKKVSLLRGTQAALTAAEKKTPATTTRVVEGMNLMFRRWGRFERCRYCVELHGGGGMGRRGVLYVSSFGDPNHHHTTASRQGPKRPKAHTGKLV